MLKHFISFQKMLHKLILNLVLCFTTVIINCEAKIYSKCDFINNLRQAGIPNDQLNTWSCIASHESNYNTQAINHDTNDFGILQISGIYWCSQSDQPGNGCDITCNSLLSDDIHEDIVCARKIWDEFQHREGNGFKAWTTYPSCQGDVSQYGCWGNKKLLTILLWIRHFKPLLKMLADNTFQTKFLRKLFVRWKEGMD